MKVNLDDPNLTAFALGELAARRPRENGGSGRSIAGSPEIRGRNAAVCPAPRAEYEADRHSRRPVRPSLSGWRRTAASVALPMGLAGGRAGDLCRDRRGGAHGDSAKRNALEAVAAWKTGTLPAALSGSGARARPWKYEVAATAGRTAGSSRRRRDERDEPSVARKAAAARSAGLAANLRAAAANAR